MIKNVALLLFLFSISVVGFSQEDSTDESPRVILAMIENVYLVEQELNEQQLKAWPNREEDQLEELSPPLKVQELINKAEKFSSQRRALLIKLKYKLGINDTGFILPEQWESNFSPLNAYLSRCSHRELAEELAPLLSISAKKKDPETLNTLLKLAKKWKPASKSILKLIVQSQDEGLAAKIFDLGVRRNHLNFINTSGRMGSVEVLDRIVGYLDDESTTEEILFKAWDGIVPPESVEARKAHHQWARSKLNEVQLDLLQTRLLSYLGRFGSEQDLDLFKSILYGKSALKNKIVSLQNLSHGGERAAKIVLNYLKRKNLAPEEQRACLYTLSVLRYKPAVEAIIPWLGVNEFKHDAKKALIRITGKDFGHRQGAWVRWWRKNS